MITVNPPLEAINQDLDLLQQWMPIFYDIYANCDVDMHVNMVGSVEIVACFLSNWVN